MLMIKSFEPVYKEIEELFIQRLPEYIEKINKDHNDGLILKRFENQTLEEVCIKKPCFKFSVEESEYSEKDRIIENTIFTICFEIQLLPSTEQETTLFWRYAETINKMLCESECTHNYKNLKIKENTIFIKVEI